MTCRRAAELISRSLDAPPGLGTRLALGLHRMGCLSCRRFGAQLAALDVAIRDAVTNRAAPSGGLPAEVAARLRAALRAETAD